MPAFSFVIGLNQINCSNLPRTTLWSSLPPELRKRYQSVNLSCFRIGSDFLCLLCSGLHIWGIPLFIFTSLVSPEEAVLLFKRFHEIHNHYTCIGSNPSFGQVQLKKLTEPRTTSTLQIPFISTASHPRFVFHTVLFPDNYYSLSSIYSPEN